MVHRGIVAGTSAATPWCLGQRLGPRRGVMNRHPETYRGSSKAVPSGSASQPSPRSSMPPLLDEGAAFEELTRRNGDDRAASGPRGGEHFDVIVVGAGQAGLSVG